MKAQEQLLCTAVFPPVFFYRLRQGLDIAGVIVVALHKAQLWNVALGFGPVVDRITHAGGGGARVLGVQRQDQDARGALGFEGIELRGHRRIAVAHGSSSPAHWSRPPPSSLAAG